MWRSRLAVAVVVGGLFGCGGPVEDPGSRGSALIESVDAGGPQECTPNTAEECPNLCVTETTGPGLPDGGMDTHTTCGSRFCDATGHWGQCELMTPLVLVFDGAPVTFSNVASASFDLAGRDHPVAVDWPTARTPWLALDVDGDGAITSGRELFGSMTRLPSGARAHHGFEALAALDTNHDGRITAADRDFSRLRLWRDDGDRRSSASELQAAPCAGIVEIDLGYRLEPRCTARGDCEVERARFTWRQGDGTLREGEVVDLHLAEQLERL